MFTFQSGEGKLDDTSYGHYNEPFTCKGVNSEVELERCVVKEGIKTLETWKAISVNYSSFRLFLQ